MIGDKLRGVVLSLLMVGSVFAVAAVPASAAGNTELTVSPSDQDVAPGATATYDIVLGTADNGVSSYDITVSTDDTNTAEITEIELGNGINNNPEIVSPETAADGSSATIQVAGADTDDTGSVAIATVTVEGQNAGDAQLSVTADAIGDDGDPVEEYTVTGTNPATVTVTDPAVADFQVVGSLTAPEEVTTDETFSVEATVVNTGGAAGQQDVEFQLAGTTVETQSVSLEPDEVKSVEFTGLSASNIGTLAYSVLTDDDSETDTIETLAPDVTGDGDSSLDQDNDGLYEDVDGSGDLNILDVQALLNNLDSDPVQLNAGLFDFNDDGAVNILDVQQLLNTV